MPGEVVSEIVSHLPYAVDALALAMTCKRMEALLAREWYRIALRSHIFDIKTLFPRSAERRMNLDRPPSWSQYADGDKTYEEIMRDEPPIIWVRIYYERAGEEDKRRRLQRPRVDYRRKILKAVNGEVNACQLCLRKELSHRLCRRPAHARGPCTRRWRVCARCWYEFRVSKVAGAAERTADLCSDVSWRTRRPRRPIRSGVGPRPCDEPRPWRTNNDGGRDLKLCRSAATYALSNLWTVSLQDTAAKDAWPSWC